MASPTVNATSLTPYPALPLSSCEPLWYAVYTSANREKRVAKQLAERSVEHFLPLYESLRRWKDRRMQLQLPLFPGYVFVRLALRDRLQVLQVPGVARLVGFDGMPTALRDDEIAALQTSLGRGLRAEPHPYLTTGRRVRVKSGPLAGLQGLLIQRKNSRRFVISLDLIMRSIMVEFEDCEVEPV